MKIDWDRLCRNPQEYEDLVKLLLRRLYPAGEIIDGSGGDEGREFQVRSPDNLTLFEAKSFTGRISSARRAQVRRSLVSAAQLQPDEWHLVVPIDHTPAELSWFDKLRVDFPFVRGWCGKGWLDEQLSKHEDLIRSTTDVRDELLELASRFNMETAVLSGGLPDLVERMNRLQALGDTIDPNWRPVVSSMPGGVSTVTLEPKHADAPARSPIQLRLNLSAPGPDGADALSKIRDAMALGTSVDIPGHLVASLQVEAPEALGLTRTAHPEFVRIVAVPDTTIERLPTQTLSVYEPGAAWPSVTHTFHPAERTAGFAATRLVSYDEGRTMKLTTDVWDDKLTINVASLDPRPVSAGLLARSWRFSFALQPPNVLELAATLHGHRSFDRIPITRPIFSSPPEPAVVQYIYDLAEIEHRTSQSIPVPPTFTPGDAAIVHRVRRMLDGEDVPWRRGAVELEANARVASVLQQVFAHTDTAVLVVVSSGYGLLIGSHMVSTGPYYLFGETRVAQDELARMREGLEVKYHLTPTENDGWFLASAGLPEIGGEVIRPPDQDPYVLIKPVPIRNEPTELTEA